VDIVEAGCRNSMSESVNAFPVCTPPKNSEIQKVSRHADHYIYLIMQAKSWKASRPVS